MGDQEQFPQPESSARPTAPRGSRIYYGWFVVAASMIIATADAGVRDIFSVSQIPFTDGFEVSPDVTSYTRLGGVLIGAFTQPILGYLFDRYDSRKVILINVAVAGVAAVIFTVVPWLLVGALLYSVVVSTAGGASFGLLGPLVARWFLKRRTLVLALLMVGLTMGSISLNPTTAYLTGVYGWRLAWIVLGAILLFLALPVGFKSLRNWPSQMGLKVDGEPESPAEASMRGSAPVDQHGQFEVASWRLAFRSPPFRVLLLVFAIGGFADPINSLPVFWLVLELTGSTYMIGLVSAVMSVLGVIGAVAGGWLADRFRRSKVLGAAFFAQGIGFALLLLTLIAGQDMNGVWMFAVLAGLAGTVWMVIALSLIADIYGLRALATLWGIAFLFNAIGRVFGPLLGGLAIDSTGGSVVLPIAASSLLLILASIMVFAVDERKYSARYQAAAGGHVVGD